MTAADVIDTSTPTSTPTPAPSGMAGLFINVHALPENFYGFFQILFLGAVYAYVLCYSSNMISDGSELLLLIKPLAGLVGSVVLPVLGAVPDGAIVLFSGMGPDAQQQLSVGIGALAGSTIMLLTMPWFLSVLGGRVNIEGGNCNYKVKLSPSDRFDWVNTGVKLAPSINTGALLMMGTSVSFLVIQIPALINGSLPDKALSKAENVWAGLAMWLCIFFFFGYLYYQYYISSDDEREKSRIDYLRQAIARKEISLSSVMASEIKHVNPNLDEATPLTVKETLKNLEVLVYPFFKKYDRDGNGTLDRDELTAVLRDMREAPNKQQRERLFTVMDMDNSGTIDYKEFVKGVYDYVQNSMKDQLKKVPGSKKEVETNIEEGGEEPDEEEEEMPEEFKDLSEAEQLKAVKIKAAWMLSVGTFLVLLFSDPMVDVLNEIGLRTNINPFYVAFVLAPLASNASEVIASYNYASKKTAASMAISLSALQGACCMNNTFVLGIFMVLVYTQGLTWAFFAETSSILLVVIILSLMCFKKNHTMLDAAIILALYPLSLVFVATLEAFGWD